MTERITITLPDGLVEDLDSLAKGAGLSRSGIIREASARYVTEARGAEATARRSSATDDLLTLLDDLRARSVLDDRPALEILRELRGPLDADRGADT
jgi:Arc/MetJ-type ribon-helix-helix transcriptional regulator